MGWWSSDIMGGDTPLDFEDRFIEVTCAHEDMPITERKKLYEEADKAFVNKVMDEILNHWGYGDPEDSYYQNLLSIGYQVLAVKMMESGAKISDELKALMEFHIPNDERSNDDQERADKINNLYHALKAYTGKAPVVY